MSSIVYIWQSNVSRRVALLSGTIEYEHTPQPPGMSINGIWQLAQFKLATECMRGDHNLRLVVGHVNLLNSLASSEDEQTQRFEEEFGAFNIAKFGPWRAQFNQQYTLNGEVAEHTAEQAPIYSPQSKDIIHNRETDQDGAGREQEFMRFAYSNISSRKRSRHPRHRKVCLSRQGKNQYEVSTLNAPESVRQPPVDQKRGITDSKEASTLAFIVAEARIDMKLDQLFETAGSKFGG